ncbi:MAG TPA: MBG domain-containing protein [Acidimicrobiales bacterium]|nr:MBG domain-containing protein [Acidimicrobiales bacterium]
MCSNQPHATATTGNGKGTHDPEGADHRPAARTSSGSSGRWAGPLRCAPARLLAAAGLFAGGLVGANAVLLAGAPVAGASTPAPTCASGTCTVTFPETGSTEPWTVPDGVSSLSVTLYGANGGGASGATGGSGARVEATVSSSPASALTVNVGGSGVAGPDGFAGYGGGGYGGEVDSGGGGGATTISEGATSVLVAGGGGGGGNFGSNLSGGPPLVVGGNGGNADTAGQAGSSTTANGATLGGGGGGGAGGQSAGGTAGPGGTATGTSTCGGTRTGSPGSPGSLGAGGGGAPDAGGGGGGGYYGGGQGAQGASDSCGDYAAFGGGGGGSSYTAGLGVSGASVDDTPTLQASSLSGNGEAVIAYADPVAAGAPSFEAVSGQALVIGAATGLGSSTAGTSGPMGDTLAVTVPSTTTAQGGTVTADANGDGGFTYTPPASFTGTDTFAYTVTDTTDGSGDYATGTASVDVLAPLQVSTTTLPGGEYGTAYDQYLGAIGGTSPYSWSVSQGSLPPGLSLSPSGVLSGTPTAAGAYSFTAKVTDSSTPTVLTTSQDLSVTVASAPLTITASSPPMTYGGAVPAITPTYSGFVNNDTAGSLTTPPTCSTTATSTSPVGSYPSSCSGAVDPNYDITYTAGSVSIGAAPLSITASSPAMVHGGAVPPITPIYSGLVAGDTAGSLTTPPTCSTTATSTSPVGSYPSSCSGAVDPNYDISYTAGSVSVGTTVLIITATSATMSYGGPAPVISPTYGGFVDGDTPASLTTPPTCSTAATSSSSPGTYSATCSGATDPNYAIGYVAGTVTVAPAPLTVTASSATFTYGGTVPVITPSYSGFVNGDTAASLTTAPTCSTSATSSSAPGTYPSLCTGAVDANYTVSYVAGTVIVSAASTPSLAPAPATTTTTTTAPPAKAFPDADIAYPNGSIVSFGGSDYVFAGGRAFAAGGSALVALQKVDHAKVVSAPGASSAPTGVALRPGALVTTRAVNGSPTIYVAGTDGQWHGFSTAGQFSRDGYDAALVVTVPSLGGLSVGATAGIEGASATALATRADGAIADSSGTFYVFAGGRAFGISSPAALVALRATDRATALTGAVGRPETSASVASGVLLSAPGKVYVSYQSELYLFKTMAQLVHDGYGGTAAVPVPGTGGLGVVSPYSGG